MKINIILIISFLFLGCNNSQKEFKPSSVIQKLADSLSVSHKSTPYLVFISDDYPKSRNYNSYQKFKKLATEDELKYLTDYKSPNIRCYAFYELVKKNTPGVRKIFEAHLEDTAQVCVCYGGCLIIRETVADFMLDKLNPSESKSSERFSKTDFGKYRKEIEKVKANH